MWYFAYGSNLNSKAVSEWFPRRESGWAVALFDSGSSIGGAIAPFLVLTIYHTFGLAPDMAAAVLITNNAKAPTNLLVQFVPDCCDAYVLNSVLEAELERGPEHQRDDVVGMIRARLAELGATPVAAANDASDSMGDAADAEHPDVVH